MNRATLALVALAAVFGEGCRKIDKMSPGASGSRAGVEHMTLSASNTTLAFAGVRNGAPLTGNFPTFTGFLDFSASGIERSRIRVVIDVGAVNTPSGALSIVLKSRAFFDAEHFPQATFESTSIAASDAGDALFIINGNLTLRGQSRAISFPASVTTTPVTLNVTADFSLNVRAFGIVAVGTPGQENQDELAIHLAVRAPRTPAPHSDAARTPSAPVRR